ncbi:MAG: TlpA family protein disulfide reductase [Planctomycetota bacterium]|nr:TlpA family protein disulfide reductase [Planctomycetaceae bacterium]MDQ3330707.1 TlpA family protein disulfide reductase [Planctomycetota bacterium]
MAASHDWTMVTAAGLIAVFLVAPTDAQEAFDSFESLRRHHAKAGFEATAAYLAAHPDAADAREAYRFLFQTALDEDLTPQAKPHAVRFLQEQADAPLSEKSRARRVAMLSLALEGEADAALDVLGEELAAFRRLDPSAAIDAATALAAAVQRGGKPEFSSRVYDRLRRTFFLNSGVETIVGNRLARLELLGKPAPAIAAPDLEGNQAILADFAGKVVLVDFWATNCPPCLEELPQLRRLYADLHSSGFEILAVSLDEEEDLVREFLARSPLPWRTILSTADDEAARNAFRIETIPANFLIGPDGKVARVDLHGNDLRSEVERMLKDAKGRTEP